MFSIIKSNRILNQIYKLNSLSLSSEIIRYDDNLSDEVEIRDEKLSVLKPNPELNLEEFAPYLRPTFNLAAYARRSETLTKLLELGVNLYKIERRKGLPEFMLKLKFDENIKDHLIFLTDNGLKPELLGKFITRNPLIFKETIENLQVRINYLESKNFDASQIATIMTKDPFWLMFPTKRIDNRLGFFQKTFSLTGDEMRALVTREPRLITYNLEHVRKNNFSVIEEMGFNKTETKMLLLKKPKLWMIDREHLLNRFDYAHHDMKLSHQEILSSPEILACRETRLKERHEFLCELGKANYSPSHDLYISPKQIVEGNDEYFVHHLAKSTMKIYDSFLKSR